MEDIDQEKHLEGISAWISSDRKMFEVSDGKYTLEFHAYDDGTFYVTLDGYYQEHLMMTSEQFSAFKRWINEISK